MNRIIMIEHELDLINCAVCVIDMGPGVGVTGGDVVAEGAPKEISKENKSLTGKYLARYF